MKEVNLLKKFEKDSKQDSVVSSKIHTERKIGA